MYNHFVNKNKKTKLSLTFYCITSKYKRKNHMYKKDKTYSANATEIYIDLHFIKHVQSTIADYTKVFTLIWFYIDEWKAAFSWRLKLNIYRKLKVPTSFWKPGYHSFNNASYITITLFDKLYRGLTVWYMNWKFTF